MFVKAIADTKNGRDGYDCSLVGSRRVDGKSLHILMHPDKIDRKTLQGLLLTDIDKYEKADGQEQTCCGCCGSHEDDTAELHPGEEQRGSTSSPSSRVWKLSGEGYDATSLLNCLNICPRLPGQKGKRQLQLPLRKKEIRSSSASELWHCPRNLRAAGWQLGFRYA